MILTATLLSTIQFLLYQLDDAVGDERAKLELRIIALVDSFIDYQESTIDGL